MIFSPLKPTKQKITIGNIKMMQKDMINFIELKSKFKIEKTIIHQIRQKIAVE